MKQIKISDEMKQSLLTKFQQFLQEGKFANNYVNFNERIDNLLKDIQKPLVAFTPEAWMKMRSLVNNATGEIGWHGLVERDKENNIYLIKQIILYPQYVAGATVNTDQKEYQEWLMALDDDTFAKTRMQGHSHVRMGVTPSGVDMAWYDSILQDLSKDDYYIFIIANKDNDLWINLYDMSQNVIFEKEDISVKIVCKGGTIEDWTKIQMDKYVKTKTWNNTTEDNVSFKNDRAETNTRAQDHTKTEREKELDARYGHYLPEKKDPITDGTIIQGKYSFLNTWTRQQFIDVQRFANAMEQKVGKEYKSWRWGKLATAYQNWLEEIWGGKA